MSNIITMTDNDAQMIVGQPNSDQQLLDLWLHGRPTTTKRAYRADANRFLSHVNKPLHTVTLGEIQSFADDLDQQALKPSSKHRVLSAVKSMFAFGHRIGWLHFDVAMPLRLPALRDALSERILSEAQVQRMLALERHPRNHALLYLLYASGVRVSECSSLRWRDLQERTDGGQVTVFGKGGNTHSVLLPTSAWSVITAVRNNASEDAPVFVSRKGRPLSSSQILRIVKAAAGERASRSRCRRTG